MVFHKNIDMILKALATLYHQNQMPFSFIMAGSGDDLDRLKKIASDLGLSEKVKFTGYVDDNQLEKLYQEAAFFIYIPVNEPFGLTLIEAMKYGIPVIGANDGGAMDIITNGQNGLLVSPQDSDSVIEAMRKLASNPLLREAMGVAARKRVETYFTLEHFVARFEISCKLHVSDKSKKR